MTSHQVSKEARVEVEVKAEAEVADVKGVVNSTEWFWCPVDCF